MVRPVEAPNPNAFTLFMTKHWTLPIALVIIGVLGVTLAASGGIGMIGTFTRVTSYSMIGAGSGVALLGFVPGLLGIRAKVEGVNEVWLPFSNARQGGQDYAEVVSRRSFAYVVGGGAQLQSQNESFIREYSSPISDIQTYHELSTHFAAQVGQLNRQERPTILAHIVCLSSDHSLRLLTAQTEGTKLFVQIDDQVTLLENDGTFRPQHFDISEGNSKDFYLSEEVKVRVFGCTEGANITVDDITKVTDSYNPVGDLARNKEGDFAIFFLDINE